MYFKYENDQYIEDENGPLCGVMGTDANGNTFQAVAFMPQTTSLQNGQQIEWLYAVYIKPNGLEQWMHSRNETIVISNSILVDPATGKVNANKPDEDLIGQLDYYIDTLFKGLGKTPVFYDDLMQMIIDKESLILPRVKMH